MENGKRDCERSRSIAQWIMGAFSIDAKDAGSSLTTEKGVTVIQGVLIEMLSPTPVKKGTFSMLGSTKYSEL